jgi:hypothetical protein
MMTMMFGRSAMPEGKADAANRVESKSAGNAFMK